VHLLKRLLRLLPANNAIHTFAIAFLLLFLLPSCGKQSDIIKTTQANLGQAKHFDVPVPLTYKLASTSSRKQQDGVSDFAQYNGSLTVAQTVSFYKREMERTGWDIIDLSTDHEGFLFCNKPSKQCGVQIRASGKPEARKATTLSLFINQGA
jgi:hypothetical protein